MQSTITVLELPPKEERSILVSTELRYGIWSRFPSDFSDMTYVRKKSLLLMNCPSLIRLFPFLSLMISCVSLIWIAV